jgi:hypothetical protein
MSTPGQHAEVSYGQHDWRRPSVFQHGAGEWLRSETTHMTSQDFDAILFDSGSQLPAADRDSALQTLRNGNSLVVSGLMFRGRVELARAVAREAGRQTVSTIYADRVTLNAGDPVVIEIMAGIERDADPDSFAYPTSTWATLTVPVAQASGRLDRIHNRWVFSHIPSPFGA